MGDYRTLTLNPRLGLYEAPQPLHWRDFSDSNVSVRFQTDDHDFILQLEDEPQELFFSI